MLRVASCDQQGSLYLDDDHAYRVIKVEHRKAVEEILRLTAHLQNAAVIETSVCEDPVIRERLSCTAGELVLRHKRVGHISYPHEWCAEMLKDAALFHLDLSLSLLKANLYLKDAHPWNILFDATGFVFVDFTSIVSQENLFSEDYLQANSDYGKSEDKLRLAQITGEIFQRMFLPYFLLPLAGYALGKAEVVHRRIDETTLNASSSVMSWRELIWQPEISRRWIKNTLSGLRLAHQVRKLMKTLKASYDIEGYIKSLHALVKGLEVSKRSSGYSSYYQQKGEDQMLEYSDSWNNKQKGVFKAINRQTIGSVLDAACNTGWYAMMAEKCGKNVIAFDIDDASVEILYSDVKRTAANLLPLVLNITQPTPDRLSVVDGNRVLINAASRLQADSVLALGIVHHLILGMGMSVDAVIDRFAALARKQLILEFVDITDDKIRGETEFFHAFHVNAKLAEGYSIDALAVSLGRYFARVERIPSHPETRTLLICER